MFRVFGEVGGDRGSYDLMVGTNRVIRHACLIILTFMLCLVGTVGHRQLCRDTLPGGNRALYVKLEAMVSTVGIHRILPGSHRGHLSGRDGDVGDRLVADVLLQPTLDPLHLTPRKVTRITVPDQKRAVG